MSAHHHGYTPATRHVSRSMGLSRGTAVVGVLAVFALQAAVTRQARRTLRRNYEDRLRAAHHQVEVTREAAEQSFSEGFTAGIEACRIEIQTSVEDDDSTLAAVLTLRPKRGTAPARTVRSRGPATGA